MDKAERRHKSISNMTENESYNMDIWIIVTVVTTKKLLLHVLLLGLHFV